jgi:predicted amidohydrolase YtcJ
VPTLKEKIEALTRAQEICFSFGLTTVTDAGLTKEDVFLIDSLQKNNLLEIRVYGMLKNEASTIDYFLEKGPLKTDRLNVRSIKLYADGALGSRGAALRSPYLDKKGHKGFFLTPIDSLEKFAYKIATTPFQLNTHAIGDAANNAVLNAYKKALVFKDDPRWRIEHAQVLDTNDISLFNRKIIPSVQPTHAVSDAPWAKERLGEERMHGAYAYKALLESAGRIALGTDFPVEVVNPISTFYAATYPPKSEEEIRSPKALEPREALYGMTKWAAEANFEEAEKGTLKIGKKADLVILDRDIIQASERRIPKTKVVATFLNGQIVFSRRYK